MNSVIRCFLFCLIYLKYADGHLEIDSETSTEKMEIETITFPLPPTDVEVEPTETTMTTQIPNLIQKGGKISSIPIFGKLVERLKNLFMRSNSSFLIPLKMKKRISNSVCMKKIEPCAKDSHYRNFDGSCNNLNRPEWGVPNSAYGRILESRYGNGISTPRKTHDRNGKLPNARKIRVNVFPTGSVNNELWTVLAMLWGQVIAHDMSLLKSPKKELNCCTKSYLSGKKKRPSLCFPINVHSDDPTLGRGGVKCLNFIRTVTDKTMGCGRKGIPAEQINVVTSWLDLSNVYGVSKKKSDSLRSFQNGQLLVEERNGRIFAPKEIDILSFCGCNMKNEDVCYKTGDSRSNQNPQLAILQTIFIREHNRIAKELAKLNPHWNDERLFQESRRILIAEYQQITYYEWLHMFLGAQNAEDKKITYFNAKFVEDYDENLDPAISNEFAHSAFRFFHTMIADRIGLYTSDRQNVSSLRMNDYFFRPSIIESTGDMIEKLMFGMVTQNSEEMDNIQVEDISDKLFSCGEKFGSDMRAIDIQRDRDHGLGYYDEYRRMAGLNETTSFDDFSDVMSSENIEALKALYKSHKDVDLTVGGSLEKPIFGTQFGPTFLDIMNEQFLRSRKADRFFFEHKESGFTLDQLKEIKKSTVSRLICDNGDGVRKMQQEGFLLIFPTGNEIKPCGEIPVVNLAKWKEEV